MQSGEEKTSSGQTQNIYMAKDAATHFAKSMQYAIEGIKSIAERLKDLLPQNRDKNLKILDIGAGPGSFTLPFVLQLLKMGFKPNTLALDIAPQMLTTLQGRLKLPEYNELNNIFFLWEHDADTGLSPRVTADSMDMVIITFVLHYISNIPELLSEVTRVLRKDGFLIQGEITGAMRYVDGTFDSVAEAPEPQWEAFWRQYFNYRNDFSPWMAEIRVTNIRPILSLLSVDNNFLEPNQFQVSWTSSLCYQNLIDWIRYGFLSSLGSDLEVMQKEELAKRMIRWCESNLIDIQKYFEVPWGIRAFCNRRM